MELSQKLRQARLDAGLSQKQLCGHRITRNMLSQIENGSARPSMETLKYLAQQLGKPVSYFLEDSAVTSPNQALIEQARQAEPSQALSLLGGYREPDPVFDWERWLLEANSCLALAQSALEKGRTEYARSLLERAAITARRTPYCTEEFFRRQLLLSFRAGLPAQALARELPPLEEELLLRAKAALEEGMPERCAAYLLACREKTALWHLLRGQGLLAQNEYTGAAKAFHQAEKEFPRQCHSALETCYRELGDFEKAYRYACLVRDGVK